jgi:hypothetical protein
MSRIKHIVLNLRSQYHKLFPPLVENPLNTPLPGDGDLAFEISGLIC